MQQVITAAEGRKILRGRTPHMPVEYDQAVKALRACCTLDDTKYWDNKADALAAWAKIYRSKDALINAKRLKLHAYRRMGELAGELRPEGPKKGNTGAGRLPGPVSLLRESGLSRTEASASRRLSLVSDAKFEKMLEQPKSPSTLMGDLWTKGDPTWRDFTNKAMNFRAFCRQNSATVVGVIAKGNDTYAETARQLVTELSEWLDELDARLNMRKKSA